MGSYLTERTKIVGCLAPVNTNTNTAAAMKPLKLDEYQRATILIYFGVISHDVNVKVYKGNTNAPLTAMAFNYIQQNDATTAYCELNGTLTAATNAGITANATNCANGIIAIEVLGADLGTNYHYVVANCVGAAGATSVMTYIALLSDARHPEATANLPSPI